MNKKLEELVGKFRPEFGNQAHINLIERIGKARKMRGTVEKHAKRVQSLKNAIAKKTETEKRLETMETSIISELETITHG